jgi:hypothetical protein
MRVRSLLPELDKLPFKYSTGDTARSQLEQMGLYCQHRAELEIVNLIRKAAGMRLLVASENTYVVTWSDGVNTLSEHQSRKAIDIAVVDPATGQPSWNYAKFAAEYRAIAAVAKRLGFVNGIDWDPIDPVTKLGKDPPHHQVP